jgi:hypothetical protein
MIYTVFDRWVCDKAHIRRMIARARHGGEQRAEGPADRWPTQPDPRPVASAGASLCEFHCVPTNAAYQKFQNF